MHSINLNECRGVTIGGSQGCMPHHFLVMTVDISNSKGSLGILRIMKKAVLVKFVKLTFLAGMSILNKIAGTVPPIICLISASLPIKSDLA